MTSKDFIENCNFSYFETYSFQRKGDFEKYDNLFLNRQNTNGTLTIQKERELTKEMQKINPYRTNSNWIFTSEKVLNPTAEKVYSSKEKDENNKLLIEILSIKFVEYDAWMCAPIYRDAILFYDNNNNLVDGLNICFNCNNVRNLKGQEILTDNFCYEKLQEYLKSKGHNINTIL